MNIRFFALTVSVLSLAACAVPEAYDGGGRGYMPPVQNQAGRTIFERFHARTVCLCASAIWTAAKSRCGWTAGVPSSLPTLPHPANAIPPNTVCSETEPSGTRKAAKPFSALPMPTAIRSKLPAAPVKRGSLFEPPSGFFGRFFMPVLFWPSAGSGGFRAWRIIFRFVLGLSCRQRLNANFKPAPISSGLLSNDKITSSASMASHASGLTWRLGLIFRQPLCSQISPLIMFLNRARLVL